jgi:SAM-dependent methyltransferase
MTESIIVRRNCKLSDRDESVPHLPGFSRFARPVKVCYKTWTGSERQAWYKNEMTNANKMLWEKGDFTEIAAFMRPSGEALVKSIGIAIPSRVLDLGCGDGTTAVPLAQLGAEVVGIDIARNLVDAGNRRATEAGLQRLKFQEGDACNLEGVCDHSFDLTISVFGAMFAPKPFDVAKEMVRVTKPGGRVVMGNWIPNDPTFVSQLLKISSSFMPPPPEGFVSPMTWGVDSHVFERFAQAGVRKEKSPWSRTAGTLRRRTKSSAGHGIFYSILWPNDECRRSGAKTGKLDELHGQLLELRNLGRIRLSPVAAPSIPATFLRVTRSPLDSLRSQLWQALLPKNQMKRRITGKSGTCFSNGSWTRNNFSE